MEKKAKILKLLEIVTPIIPAPIYWEDVNSVLLGGNDAVFKATGAGNAKAYVGKNLFELYPEEMAAHIKKHNEEVMRTGQILSQEEAIEDITTGEFKYFTAVKAPLFDDSGKIIGIVGTSIDITDRKRMEEELHHAKEKAEAANHAKTEFIANMSHDIRTPLAGVIGLANILESQVTDPIHKKEAHDLGQSGNELLSMLNEILDVIAADHVNTNDIHEGPFRLSDLVQGIVNLEQPSVTVKNIELTSKIDSNIPVVLISDYKKIHHILLNLVGNAIKFTTAGHVEVTATLLQRKIDTVMLEFQVIDTGKGIPNEALAHVFDPFFRVTPSYKGLDKGHGLGLHIAQTYVQLLGGNIKVTSKLNEGSKFTFTLPIKIGDQNALLIPMSSAIPPVQTSENLSPSDMSQSEQPKVLIIEDNPIALTVAETLLKNASWATTPAVDGESGLELAKTQSFDVIVSDVGLPGMSGIEFTRQLRAYEKEQQKQPIPIIGLTAHAEGKTRDECMEAGMNDVTIKPLTLKTVQTIMTQFSLFDAPHSKQPEDIKITPHIPNTSTKLGMDLPDTETELFQLEAFSLLDAALAIKELGDNKPLLVNMLKAFLEQIPQEKQAIHTAYKAKNWSQIEKLAHKMKGGTVYLKLNKLSIACQYLERYHKAGHSNLLEDLYQQMTKVMEESLAAVVKWLEENQ